MHGGLLGRLAEAVESAVGRPNGAVGAAQRVDRVTQGDRVRRGAFLEPTLRQNMGVELGVAGCATPSSHGRNSQLPAHRLPTPKAVAL